MPAKTIRTTVTLPTDLLTAADLAVRAGEARSRNELVANALRRELASIERAAIDAAFAGMADDKAYLEEARVISDEFVQADWEAYRLGEQQHAGKQR